MVRVWRPRLGIAEVVHVEVVPDDESSERELEARCIPIERDGVGFWEFTIQVGDTIEAERLERAIVHELVHVIMAPLHAAYFDGGSLSSGNGSREQDLERWETAVDRLADSFLRAYAVPVV